MAKKQDFKLDGDYQDAFQTKVEGAVEWLGNKDNAGKRNNLLYILLAIVIAGFAYTHYSNSQKATEVAKREALGEALNLFYANKYAESVPVLEAFLNDPTIIGQLRAKGNLLLGEVFYYEGKYAEAKSAYDKALTDGSGLDLIESAAEHGLAAVQIQEGNYEGAAQSLEAFLKKWSRRTKSIQMGENAPEDKIVTIPDVLVQLSLCYQKLGKNDLAKAKVEEVLAKYPNSRQAGTAKKVLTVL